jgi:hypothetical protein
MRMIDSKRKNDQHSCYRPCPHAQLEVESLAFSSTIPLTANTDAHSLFCRTTLVLLNLVLIHTVTKTASSPYPLFPSYLYIPLNLFPHRFSVSFPCHLSVTQSHHEQTDFSSSPSFSIRVYQLSEAVKCTNI